MSSLFRTITIFAAITVTSAVSLIGVTRDGDLTHFTALWPTCADNKALTGGEPLTLIGPGPVTVQPDCDNVIDSLCKVTVAQAPAYHDLSNTNGSCEGHMMFSRQTPIDYGECVAQFQSITESCMLIDPGFKNYAAPGHQFGVRNIVHNGATGAGEGDGTLAWNSDGEHAGYMLGPPGVFHGVYGSNSALFNFSDPSKPF